jgi:hypothetical protein
MHTSGQMSRGRLLRAKAAPLQAWLPPILPPRQKSVTLCPRDSAASDRCALADDDTWSHRVTAHHTRHD